MNKVTGLWVMTDVSGFVKFCKKNDIEYQEWTDKDCFYEIRIDMFYLNQEQIDELKGYLDRDDIDEYAYVITYS